MNKFMRAWNSEAGQGIGKWFKNDDLDFLPIFVATCLAILFTAIFVVVMVPPIYWVAHYYWEFWGMSG